MSIAQRITMLALTLSTFVQPIYAAPIVSSAPEKLAVVVLSSAVKDQRGKDCQEVTLKVAVLKVKRTKAKVKPGDVITVTYLRNHARARREKANFEKKAEVDRRARRMIMVTDRMHYVVPPLPKKGQIWELALEQRKKGVFEPDVIYFDGFRQIQWDPYAPKMIPQLVPTAEPVEPPPDELPPQR